MLFNCKISCGILFDNFLKCNRLCLWIASAFRCNFSNLSIGNSFNFNIRSQIILKRLFGSLTVSYSSENISSNVWNPISLNSFSVSAGASRIKIRLDKIGPKTFSVNRG